MTTRGWVGAALIIALAGCSGSTKTSSGKDDTGCATVDKALIAYADFRDGISDGTSTPADAAKSLATIKKNMDAVSVAGAAGLRSDASAAALSAGRLRVAVTTGDSSTVSAEATALGTAMDAVAHYCA